MNATTRNKTENINIKMCVIRHIMKILLDDNAEAATKEYLKERLDNLNHGTNEPLRDLLRYTIRNNLTKYESCNEAIIQDKIQSLETELTNEDISNEQLQKMYKSYQELKRMHKNL